LGDARGGSAVEFALLALPLLIMTLGSIELGLLMWTTNVLEATADDTARCVAIAGSSCTNGSTYAAGQASRSLFTGSVSAGEVSVLNGGSCNGLAGNYVVVTITAHHWAASGLVSALSRAAIVAKACYPVSG
jgi:Flp pilus assembly protein TadG